MDDEQPTPPGGKTAPDAGSTESLPPSFIVGIGASAGGLEALERLFHAMPPNTGMAFVVLQHLSPDFESVMDELLARCTPMPIVVVDEPVAPQPNTIYLLGPRQELTLQHGALYTHACPSGERLSMPINAFFRSLSSELGERAVAIVLSGTGTDGSQGVYDIHAGGGLVLVQSPQSAKFDGMPRSAVATNYVDAVLLPEEMPAVLLAHAMQRSPLGRTLPANSVEDPRGIARVIGRLRELYGLDFNYYKPATISRRIERRVTLDGAGTLPEYCARVLGSPEELDALYRDLLIGVTRFFRDPEAFAVLQEQVIPKLLDRIAPEEEVRIWVAGCATGEEAYSLAILLLEAMAARQRAPHFRIFASDVHRKSLEIAAEGIYCEASLAELGEDRRTSFFEATAGGFRVSAKLRQHILFSPHNVIRDPPYTRIDLVSCRNLFIYLQPVAQIKALASFHFALKRHGYLFLGPSEGVAELQSEFEPLNRQWRIFQKLRDTRLPGNLRTDLISPPGPQIGQAATPGDVRMSRIYEALLQRFVRSGVLVDSRRDVVHIFGDAERYLHVPPGRMSTDLVAMTRGSLRSALASLFHSALKSHEPVAFRNIRVEEEGGSLLVDLAAEPIFDSVLNSQFVLFRFSQSSQRSDPKPRLPPETSPALEEEARARIRQLEEELLHAQESLKVTVEQLETSNEELQASNEELLAANEELQSTNEELHSVNEELYSVNAEHEQRIKDLNRVSGDLKNLIQATEIGTIFLNSQLQVRFFTPAIRQVLNLLPQDIDRDIRHITSRLTSGELFADIAKVAATGVPIERRVSTVDGNVYLQRAVPYFDVNRSPDGLVLTFVDITSLSRTEEQRQALHAELEQRVREQQKLFQQTIEQRDALDRSERFIRTITDNLPGMVGYWDTELRCRFANRAYVDWFGKQPDEILGITMPELLGPELFAKNEPYVRGALAGQPQHFDRAIRKPSGVTGYTQASYIPLVQNDDVRGFVVLVSDISERRRGEELVRSLNHDLQQRVQQLRESEERFRLIFESALDGIVTADQEGRICLVNPMIEKLFGYSKDELLGQSIELLVPSDRRGAHAEHRQRYAEEPKPRSMGDVRNLFGQRKDGGLMQLEIGLSPLRYSDRTQVMAYVRDITLQRHLEAERDEAMQRITQEQKLESLWLLAGGVAHDFNNLLTIIMAGANLLACDGKLDAPGTESISLILDASRRAAELCQQLLAYSGRSSFVFEPEDLSRLVQALTKLLQAALGGHRIELRLELSPQLPPVSMDVTQIRRLLMNLAVNAAEAIAENPGTITIRTGCTELSPEWAQLALSIDEQLPRACVFVEVEDTGCGIQPENLKRVVDPFYTTKFTGRGLGLSAVLGIVRAHHGALFIQSEVGRGTKCTVLLPPASTPQPRPAPATGSSSAAFRGSGKVLLVDDEASIRIISARLLSRLGFEVELATSGQAALDAFARDPEGYALVMLDLTMPGLSGVEVLSEIRRRQPRQRALLVSGFSPEEAQDKMGGHVPDGFLAKPFDVETFNAAVQAALGSSRLA